MGSPGWAFDPLFWIPRKLSAAWAVCIRRLSIIVEMKASFGLPWLGAALSAEAVVVSWACPRQDVMGIGIQDLEAHALRTSQRANMKKLSDGHPNHSGPRGTVAHEFLNVCRVMTSNCSATINSPHMIRGFTLSLSSQDVTSKPKSTVIGSLCQENNMQAPKNSVQNLHTYFPPISMCL